MVPREKTIKSLAKSLKTTEDKLFEYIENKKSKPQKVVFEKNVLKPRAKRNGKQRAEKMPVEKMPDDLIQSMKNLRISRGLSQKSLAQEMGVSQSTIAFLEQGRMKISENLKNRIIAYLEN